jgi:long-chain acyl-CoA synthetase
MNTTEAICRNLRHCPDQPALIEGDLRLNWRQMHDRVTKLAGALAARGIGTGERVALLLDNAARNVEATYAAQWIGAAVVPINTRWTAAEIGLALADCAAVAIVVDGANAETLAAVDSVMRRKLLTIWAGPSACPIGMTDYETLLASGTPLARCELPSEAIASIFYTGGTTGRSKGVPLTHANQMSHSIAMIADCGIPRGSRYLHAAPMFHIADSLFTHIVTLLGGAHTILRRFTPTDFADAIVENFVELTMLVPTMIGMVLADEAISARAFGTLQRLFYGGSPMPEALLGVLLTRFPALKLYQLYGQTESSPVLAILPPEWHGLDDRRAKARAAGRAMLGTEIRIVDPDGRETPTREMGEIVARGPQVMAGYWQRPTETEAALRGGWLHTGDAGFVDEDGFVYVADRIKDMIITGGENVYSVEVEQVLYRMPEVAQCCVVGLPHEKWGESVHAIVVPVSGAELSEAKVLAHCQPLLADYKRPRSATIRFEPLPLSGAGKILKRGLRDELCRKTEMSR